MHLAVIGDIHGFWDARDTAYFNRSGYDALLFVGDLPRLTGGRWVARELARLTKRAWLIPGNHDAVTTGQLLAEVKGWTTARRVLAAGMAARSRRLAADLGPVRLTGFETHSLGPGLGLIAARPHAMGPDRFYYQAYLQAHHSVPDFAASADKLRGLVDASPDDLLFLAHNGPAGLGDHADDPWGCDFSDAFGDFGDPDLREAVDYARRTGRRVLAVVAGHMHHHRKNGGRRRTAAREAETLFVNAARVPRIRADGGWRHHVALTIGDDGARAESVIVDAAGEELERTALPD